MKEITAVLFSVLLLSMGFSANSEVLANTIQEEREMVIEELKEIENSPDVDKKAKKNIKSAIKQLEKNIKKKKWENESTINFNYAKKLLNTDQNAIKKLDKVLKDKKTDDVIKAEILEINLKITLLQKELLENAIPILQEIITSDKGIKKLDKVIEEFETGNEFLDDENYNEALKNYSKAWNHIKKVLKDPHWKKMKIVEGEGSLDLSFDPEGLHDIYLKITKSAKNNKPKTIEVKINNECVNGITHEDAKMKIGLSEPNSDTGVKSLVFFDEEMQATNEWFKNNDPDKRIDPAIISTRAEYSSFPVSGDDLIQKNIENGEESFTFTAESISEIDDQSGWSGKFNIDADPGEYRLHFWFPTTGPTNQGDSCNFVTNLSIPQEFV